MHYDWVYSTAWPRLSLNLQRKNDNQNSISISLCLASLFSVLQGSDPSTYEMIQKIQTLQKRLIAKTEEVVEKELLIQEKEKLYVELKHILARQPGPEVAEQLQIYQQTLKEKTKQMKAMASELNMYESQVSEYKYEIERLARELQEVKKKYYMQKRKEQQIK